MWGQCGAGRIRSWLRGCPIASVDGDGRCWARTSDLRLVEADWPAYGCAGLHKQAHKSPASGGIPACTLQHAYAPRSNELWGQCGAGRSLGVAAAVAIALLAAGVAPARAAVTFTPAGPQARKWTDWEHADKAPLPVAGVTIRVLPQDTICSGDVDGCRAKFGDRQYEVYADSRGAFYFELGGIYDWSTLTSGERRHLGWAWGAPHWHWWDTMAGLEYGLEDGLEGTFPAIYEDCAWGNDTTGTSYSQSVQAGVHIQVPSIFTGSFDTCAYIRDLADPVRAPEALSIRAERRL